MLAKIITMKSFSEKKASNYVKTILSAVGYMHSLNIVHRDLKARNMVFDKPGRDGKLVIIDFGESKIIDDNKLYTDFIGSIHYVKYRKFRIFPFKLVYKCTVCIFRSVQRLYDQELLRN